MGWGKAGFVETNVQKLKVDDTWNILEYEKRRPAFRAEIVALTQRRRVEVGDSIALVFENRATALFQIQEMIRIERLVDEEQIAQEVAVYNSLIPDDGELSATLFVACEDRAALRALLQQLVGLDRHVALHIGDRFVIPARFEPGRCREDGISSIQYLRFSLPPAAQDAFRRGDEPVAIVIDHPLYQAKAVLSEETRAALAEDLE